ncbi:MAG: hypothetical protein K940chlam7_01127 [Chlamydiae bacterium]|nr:hypothetical protein [Chlamydiota bacterium]
MSGSTGGVGGPSATPDPENQPPNVPQEEGIKEKFIKLGGLFMKRGAKKIPVKGSQFQATEEAKNQKTSFEKVAKFGKESAAIPDTWKEVKRLPAFGEQLNMRGGGDGHRFRFSKAGNFRVWESPSTPGRFCLCVATNERQGYFENFFFEATQEGYTLLDDNLEPQKTYTHLDELEDDIAGKTNLSLSPWNPNQEKIDGYVTTVNNHSAYNSNLGAYERPRQHLSGLASDCYMITGHHAGSKNPFYVWLGSQIDPVNFRATSSGFVRLDSKGNQQGKSFQTLDSLLDGIARGPGGGKLRPYDEKSLIKENEKSIREDKSAFTVMDGYQATNHLKNLQPGAYMLRESGRHPGLFSFSITDYKGDVNHINFKVTPQGFVQWPNPSRNDSINDIKSLLEKIVKNEGLPDPIPHTQATGAEYTQAKKAAPTHGVPNRAAEYKGDRNIDLGKIVIRVLTLIDRGDKDPCHILGVDSSAYKAPMLKAWKNAMLTTHPDKLPGGEDNPDHQLVTDVNQEINAAWTAIKKENKW